MSNPIQYDKYSCDICGQKFYTKHHLINEADNSYIDCFEIIDNYYLDDNDWSYKPCYYTCKRCEINGSETNHNCLSCKDDFFYEYNIINTNYKNCYNNSHTKNRTEIIQNIINNFISEFNIINLYNGKYIKIVDENLIIKLTSTSNQKNNEEENNITIDLCQCENILKEEYNISEDDSLCILQIIYEEEGMKIPKIEYEVYYPLNNSNDLTKLNLELCKDTKIEISIKVKINEHLDKHNPKSDYYNDICHKTTSKCDTDISLNDRRNEFVDNNMTLCEENCDLIEYNYVKEKVKCSCDIKLSIPSNYDIKFNKNEFFKSFTDIKNIANIDIIKCYKIVLNINNLIQNFGFCIMVSIIILFLMTILLFMFISYSKNRFIYYI